MKKLLLPTFLFIAGIATGVFFLLLTEGQELISPFSSIAAILPTRPKVIGFLPYWLIDKSEPSYQGKITELSYFSLPLDGDGTIKRQVNAQEEEPGWTALNRNQSLAQKLVKSKQPNGSLSLVVFSGDKSVIEKVISNPAKNAVNLISDVAPIIRQWGFTDLNLDLENTENASQSARNNFTQFVSEVKKQMVSQNLGTLTLDLQSISLFQPYLTDATALGKIADYLVIMAYDFHFPGSVLSGPVAPIGGAGDERVFDVDLSLRAALKQIPKQKIILGIPLYGYEWNTIDNYPDAPAIPGTGVLASDDRVVSNVLNNCANCTTGNDPVAREPYVIFPEGSHYHQIFYENSLAISEKLALAKKWGIAGVAFWALGYETANDLNPLNDYVNSIVF